MLLTMQTNASRILPAGFFGEHAYSRYSHVILSVYSLFAALSIGVSQICVIALVIYWLSFQLAARRTDNSESDDQMGSDNKGLFELLTLEKILAAPILIWLGACTISSIVGVDPLRSLDEVLNALVFSLLPFCVSSSFKPFLGDKVAIIARVRHYASLLIVGQCLAAVHTILGAAVGTELRPNIPGPVTESGQLVLILPAAAGLLFSHLLSDNNTSLRKEEASWALILSPRCVSLFAGALIAAWGRIFVEAGLIANLITASGVCLAAAAVWSMCREGRGANFVDSSKLASNVKFLSSACALLLSVLLINLKRGPWLGVLISFLCISALLSRRLFVGTLLASICFIAFLSPVRDRLLSSGRDFSLDGGRQYMWSLGRELAQRFPLGLGPDNARFMRVVSPSLPEGHRHMHNNILNVLVETGWLGLFCYLWWLYVSIRFGFYIYRCLLKSSDALAYSLAPLALSLGSALLGWQAAGLVEYNFGDSEIVMLAFFYLGLLLALGQLPARKQGGVS